MHHIIFTFSFLFALSAAVAQTPEDKVLQEAKEKAVQMFFDGELDEKSPQSQPTADESGNTQPEAETPEMGTNDEGVDQGDEPDPFLDED